MFCFRAARPAKGAGYVPVSISESEETLRERVDSLSGDERHIFQWLQGYYSERWIAETLFISRSRFRELSASLCRKLGVPNVRAMRRVYSRIPTAEDRPGWTEELDDYIERRTEEEIAQILQEEKERGGYRHGIV